MVRFFSFIKSKSEECKDFSGPFLLTLSVLPSVRSYVHYDSYLPKRQLLFGSLVSFLFSEIEKKGEIIKYREGQAITSVVADCIIIYTCAYDANMGAVKVGINRLTGTCK